MFEFGLIGYPLSHSFSRKFFTEKFSMESIDASYQNFELKSIDLLPPLISNHPELLGFNVTIPYKESVIPYLDTVESEAFQIGAVNTVKIERKVGVIKLHGYNTDLTGFKESIRPILKPGHQRVLILGSGGASKAVVYAINSLGLDYLIVSRAKRGEKFITYEDISEDIIHDYSVIVNTTPLGTFPHPEDFPDIPYHLLGKNHLLFDLVYNPPVTVFLQKGIDMGATAKNGFEMLELQALAAWEIWKGN